MKNYRVILIVFLIGITIFSAFKYASSLKEKYDLINTVNKMKEDVAALESEKQLLSQELEEERDVKQQVVEENMGLQDSLKASAEKLTKLSSDFVSLQNELEHISSQLVDLKEERERLSTQVAQVTEERDTFQVRLGSITELKKAIRELKRQMRKVNVGIKEKVNHGTVIEGNRGFIVRDGKTTFPAKINIEVIPAAPLTQGVLSSESSTS